MNALPVRWRSDAALAAVPPLFAPRPDAAKRFLEFFAAQIRNPNTRKAYFRAVAQFADWCEVRIPTIVTGHSEDRDRRGAW